MIGSICPDDSVILKRRQIDNDSCSSGEDAVITADSNDGKKISSTAQEISLAQNGNLTELTADQTPPPSSPVVGGIDSSLENGNLQSEDDMMEDTLRDILSSSAILEKVLHQWKDALNKHAELLDNKDKVM